MKRFRWDIYSIHCHTFEAFTSHYQDYQDWPTGLYHRMIYWLQSVFFVLHCAAIKWITQLAAGQIYENCFIIISMKSYSQLTLAQVKKACWYILFKVGVCAITGQNMLCYYTSGRKSPIRSKVAENGKFLFCHHF